MTQNNAQDLPPESMPTGAPSAGLLSSVNHPLSDS